MSAIPHYTIGVNEIVGKQTSDTQECVLLRAGVAYGLLFSRFLNLICRKILRLLGWGIGLSQDHYLSRTVETHRKPRQISVSGVRIEPR